jgi:hypothetical protein
LFTSWLVRCPTPEDSRRIQQQLPEQIELDRTLGQEVRAFPAGIEVRTEHTHRLGDYFASIRLLPAADSSSFRILFHRRADAMRYWKDLMVRILQDLRQTSPETVTTLEYRGDAEPGGVAAAH